MGFFNKLFGAKGAADQAAVASQDADIFSVLSMHLRGEEGPALSAYLGIAAELPEKNLAPFFASAIISGTESTAAAAERLRILSADSAAKGETISRAICRDLFALLQNEPTLSVPAVTGIIESFGDRLKADGFVQESAVCFEIAVGLNPNNALLLYKFGDTLHDLRIYDYAETVLQEALKQAPNNWGALYTYGVLLQDLGRFAEAITCYEKAVKMDPNHVKCQNNYGSALMMTGQLDEALDHCTVAAELDPCFPLTKVNLGNIYLLLQQYEAARTSFTEAIALDENIAPAYYGLGSAELFIGSDTGRVRELYLKAIEVNPLIPMFHHALGNLLADEGDAEALAYFAVVVNMNNTMEHLYTDFASACLKLGRRDEALQHLRTALEQNPDDVRARDILSSENMTL